MSRLELPLFPEDMSLNETLVSMHSVGRAAGVVLRNGAFHLVAAADVAVARSKGIKTLGEVPTRGPAEIDGTGQVRLGHAVRVTTQMSVGGYELSVEAPGESGQAHVDAFLTKTGYGRSVWQSAGFQRIDHPRIDVLLPEGADTLAFGLPPRDYYCNGDPRHDFPPPIVREGDLCPRMDGAHIVSSR